MLLPRPLLIRQTGRVYCWRHASLRSAILGSPSSWSAERTGTPYRTVGPSLHVTMSGLCNQLPSTTRLSSGRWANAPQPNLRAPVAVGALCVRASRERASMMCAGNFSTQLSLATSFQLDAQENETGNSCR